MHDAIEPKGMDYWYIGEDEKWHIKEDAPEWAKEEFTTFFKSDESDDGIITL